MGRSNKNYWIAAMVAGLFTLATAIGLGGQFPSDFAEDSTDYRDPIMAFEFAESHADLIAIFGGADDPARAARQAAMDQGHDADRYFLIVYSFFIMTFFLALYRESGRKVLQLGILLAVVAGVTDIWENAILRDLTYALDDVGAANALLAQLHTATWAKWFALALGSALSSYALYQNKRRVLALFALPGFLLALPAFFDPRGYATLFVDMIGLWFLVMLIAAMLNFKRADGDKTT